MIFFWIIALIQRIICFLSFGLFFCPSNPAPLPSLSLEGLSPTTFNPVATNVKVLFDTAGPIQFEVNDDDLVAMSLIETNSFSVNGLTNLSLGSNTVKFSAQTMGGETVAFDDTLWAGTASLTVELSFDSDPFLQESLVSLRLADDLDVVVNTTTSTGSATFQNIPPRTILVAAFGPGNEIGSAGVVGGNVASVSVQMEGIGEPSDVDNNDFSMGTDGWTLSNATAVEVENHVPNPGPTSPLLSGRRRQLFNFFDEPLENKDLCVDTNGVEGETSVMRVFVSQPGSTIVYLRYRFQTNEVPGGFFGSKYNDYFRVTIRSQSKGSIVADFGTMNGLGLAAFDSNGATRWRDAWLALDEVGDRVQVNAIVANVGDGLYQSKVCIDFVEVWDCTNEVLEAVLAVGFFDAWEAGKDLADEAKDATATSGLTGFFQGPADAFRHCYWNCRMAQEIGASEATAVGTLHESCDPGASANDIAMDLNNNAIGRSLASSGDCNSACQSSLTNGDLTVLNPNAMP